ncbi:MAG: hypothetical protein LC746_11465 [Acidobacteria bacterium]|nr:hypothetical protein [Acidobacteriota bacterium]
MKRLAARLPVALATFFISLLVTAALTRVAPKTNAPASSCDKLPATNATPAATPDAVSSEPTPPADKTTRISQQAVVTFPGVGRVSVSALETLGEGLRLEFHDASTGNLLETAYVGGSAEADDIVKPLIKFRVLHVEGLPDPLVVAVTVSPGGSDCRWESAAVGAVDGKLVELTREHLEAFDEGGFYYGDLGRGRGFGAVSWDFIWGDESHISPHQYELKIYKWNPKTASFEWHQVLRTREKFEDGEKAIRSLGFDLRDVRRSFPDFKDLY